jgi:ABC-type multidrug transport system ATPase subunit
MKTCPQCRTDNALESNFCRQCGKPFPSADSTVRWSGEMLPLKSPRRTLPLAKLFAGKTQILVGRAPECDVCLPHPSVSRHHARITLGKEGIFLQDLGSLNGVLVNGRRLGESRYVKENERVGIGPFLFRHHGGDVFILDSSQSLRLEARGLEKVVTTLEGSPRKLLDNINLAVEPGEFVSLLGPSGSGKSTLMDCLNGRRPGTGGQVLANGENFYVHFDSFRQSLGYVPQRDIVHTQLPVARALYYTARLRLPSDTGPTELQSRIDEVVKLMELGPHQQTLIGQLSGGQIKRVSLGAELLARPCLLYIDEATSGLDAGTEARMMRLFRQLADDGKSVICITHNVDNVDLCNLIIVLVRGKLVYYGPPAEARPYFGVTRISEIYDSLAAKQPDDWEKQFAECSLYKEFVEKRLSADHGPANDKVEPSPSGSVTALPAARRHFPFWHQFWILTVRYLELIGRDRYGLRLLLLQAPIVGLFILCGFMGKPYEEKVLVPRKLEPHERDMLKNVAAAQREFKKQHPDAFTNMSKRVAMGWELPGTMADMEGPVFPEHVIVNPRFTYILLFLIVVIVLWFGVNNASKEIVKEEAIYSRERAVNLGLVPYLSSKFLVLSVITSMQALLLMVCIYGPLEFAHWQYGFQFPAPEYRLDYVEEFGVLVVLSMTGVALGLFLSSVVTTPDQANTLLPYVLIPQIILGGGILSVKDGVLLYLAEVLSPAYWAYRAIHRGATTLPPDVPIAMIYDDNVWLACGALAVQMAVLLGLIAYFMRRKDTRKA